jgi:hypothetical protein
VAVGRMRMCQQSFSALAIRPKRRFHAGTKYKYSAVLYLRGGVPALLCRGATSVSTPRPALISNLSQSLNVFTFSHALLHTFVSSLFSAPFHNLQPEEMHKLAGRIAGLNPCFIPRRGGKSALGLQG